MFVHVFKLFFFKYCLVFQEILELESTIEKYYQTMWNHKNLKYSRVQKKYIWFIGYLIYKTMNKLCKRMKASSWFITGLCTSI